MTTGGPRRDEEERPLRRAPQLAVLLEGGDRKGLLHDMTAAILRHGGDIVLVEIIERGTRSVIYWELDGIDDPEGLKRSFLEIDVVESHQRLPTMYQVWGKRIIVVGAGAQVGQVAIGAIGEADRHNIRGEKISVDTIPIVGETNLANAVRAVARLPRAVAVVLAGSLMGGEVTKAVDEIRARGILVVALNMAGSAASARRPGGHRPGPGRGDGGDGRRLHGLLRHRPGPRPPVLTRAGADGTASRAFG